MNDPNHDYRKHQKDLPVVAGNTSNSHAVTLKYWCGVASGESIPGTYAISLPALDLLLPVVHRQIQYIPNPQQGELHCVTNDAV